MSASRRRRNREHREKIRVALDDKMMLQFDKYVNPFKLPQRVTRPTEPMDTRTRTVRRLDEALDGHVTRGREAISEL